MMKIPPLVKAVPRDDYVLEAHFSGGEVKCYDLKPLIDTDPEIAVLKNSVLFKNVYVNAYDHGMSVYWPGILRISAAELYQSGWSEKLSAKEMFRYEFHSDLWRDVFKDLPEQSDK